MSSIIHYTNTTPALQPARIPNRRISIDSTLEADSCDLASVTVLPTDEKSRSDCAELADMANTRRATVDRMGYCLAWSFQNWRGAVI